MDDRTRSRVRLATTVAGVALVGGGAWADPVGGLMTGLGTLATKLAVGLGVESLVIVVEFLVYRLVLKLTWGKALITSLVANVASFAAGWVAALVLVGMDAAPKSAVAVALLLGIEVPIVVWLNRSYPNRRRLVWVAVLVNLGTYIAARAIILSAAASVTAR